MILISAVIGEICKYPMLTLVDERRYMAAWQETEEKRALEALMTSHLRLVAKFANGFKRYGLS
jgi:RNA polymerase sigma-32 factor